MATKKWEDLNNTFHSESHIRTDNPYNRNQRYFNQAIMLMLMKKHGLIEDHRWLDWGSGAGSLSRILKKYFDIKLLTFDKYYTAESNPVKNKELIKNNFDLVVNTAVFEHVRDRETLDEIESFVSKHGCFAIHTLIPENIPKNPNWMYLLPVHCAFHTNKSMQILMNQWGYTCSVYNEHAKLWVLFRDDIELIKNKVLELNQSLGWEYLHFKAGFMDYWQ